MIKRFYNRNAETFCDAVELSYPHGSSVMVVYHEEPEHIKIAAHTKNESMILTQFSTGALCLASVDQIKEKRYIVRLPVNDEIKVYVQPLNDGKLKLVKCEDPEHTISFVRDLAVRAFPLALKL